MVRKVFNRMITILLENLTRSFGKTSSPRKEVLKMLSTSKNTEPAAGVQASRLETKPYRLHKLDHGPSAFVILTKEEASNLYRAMIIIRTMENATGNLYKEREIRGFCHLYSGQEAVAVGVRAALRSHDCVITAYRAHAWTYLMGVPVLNVLAELMGRRSGCARGKGGSMHMYGDNFYGGNGIVGAQVPLGVGIALAAKYKGTDGVCVASYGDGAANQGQIFESFNSAKIWNLPCVFLCENNGYGMGTSAARSSASTYYYKRGDFVPGIWVDGMDVVTVREAARFAIEHCSSGKGPILLECATYRYSGHSMSDPGTSYRTRDEIQDVRRMRDPITSFRKKMIGSNLLTVDEMDVIDGEVEKSMRDVVNRAKLDEEVGLEELTGDIYCCNLECGIRNTDPFTPLPHKNVGATVDQV